LALLGSTLLACAGDSAGPILADIDPVVTDGAADGGQRDTGSLNPDAADGGPRVSTLALPASLVLDQRFDFKYNATSGRAHLVTDKGKSLVHAVFEVASRTWSQAAPIADASGKPHAYFGHPDRGKGWPRIAAAGPSAKEEVYVAWIQPWTLRYVRKQGSNWSAIHLHQDPIQPQVAIEQVELSTFDNTVRIAYGGDALGGRLGSLTAEGIAVEHPVAPLAGKAIRSASTSVDTYYWTHFVKGTVFAFQDPASSVSISAKCSKCDVAAGDLAVDSAETPHVVFARSTSRWFSPLIPDANCRQYPEGNSTRCYYTHSLAYQRPGQGDQITVHAYHKPSDAELTQGAGYRFPGRASLVIVKDRPLIAFDEFDRVYLTWIAGGKVQTPVEIGPGAAPVMIAVDQEVFLITEMGQTLYRIADF
jgi:hypothetical protein